MSTDRPLPDPAAAPGGRTHYQGLDFLRGVAAIAVVGFHFSSRLDLPSLFYRGYLGVDFFFTLSGFVIAHAYGARLASGAMPFRAFFLLRAVRLLPLVVFGTLIAAVVDLLRPGDFTLAQHLADIAAALLMGCLCLPTLWHSTLEPTVFPLNSPVWSLFFELLANFCWVPLFRSGFAARITGAIAAGSLVLIAGATLAHDSVDLGSVPADFLWGFPRVAWSFSLGILLSRSRLAVPSLNKWVYAAVLGAVLACPALPPGLDGPFDLLAIAVLFPAIVLGASRCQGAERPSRLSGWSGDMSYPLYATHYPLVRAVGLAGRRLTDSVAGHFLVAGLGTAAMVLFSAAVYAVYDVPVRHWITARLRTGRSGSGKTGMADLPLPLAGEGRGEGGATRLEAN